MSLSLLQKRCLRTAAVLVSLIVVSGPLALCRTASRHAGRSAQEENIREAVIRYELAWTHAGNTVHDEGTDRAGAAIAAHLDARLVFVSINGKDPSDQFLKRLRNVPCVLKHACPLRKVSEASTFPWVSDKETHAPGWVVSADDIRWKGRKKAVVEGGVSCGSLCGEEQEFVVRLRHGRWRVKRMRVKGVS